MNISMKAAQMSAVTGIAGAVLVIVVDLIDFIIRDVLPKALNIGQGSDLLGLVGLFAYCFSIAVALAVGCGAIWFARKGALSIRSAIIFSAIAGIAFGAVGFVYQDIYDLILWPFVVGYSYSALEALIWILYNCIDIATMAGLAIAGGALYTVFVIKPDAVLVEAPIKN